MSTAYVEIDPDGDTLIVLPTLESTSARMLYEGSLQERLKSFATAMAAVEHEPEYATVSQLTAEREPVAEEVEVGHTPESEAQTHFRVSMKHLVLASPRAKRMFQGNYTEARPDADGLHRWTFEPLFDPAAFEIVMNAIHGYSHKMPRNVSLENMAKIAAIVDDLDCPQALWFFAKTWINWLKPNRKLDRFHLGHWILISFVFEEPVIFKEATEQAIRQTCGSFSSCMLPIRPKILDTIDAPREKHIGETISTLNSLVEDVRECDCQPECKSLVFGALMLELMSAKLIFPSPSTPFPGTSLDEIRSKLMNIRMPDIYRPSESFKQGWKRSKDLWFFQAAPKEVSGGLARKEPYKVEHHKCPLQDLITSSVSGLLTPVSGLELSNVR